MPGTDQNKKLIWIIVAVVCLLVVLPMIVIVGAGVAGYLTFRSAAQEQQVEAARARERAMQAEQEQLERARRAEEEAMRRLQERKRRTGDAAAQQPPAPDPNDPLQGL